MILPFFHRKDAENAKFFKEIFPLRSLRLCGELSNRPVNFSLFSFFTAKTQSSQSFFIKRNFFSAPSASLR
jgi:hypothetical protein